MGDARRRLARIFSVSLSIRSCSCFLMRVVRVLVIEETTSITRPEKMFRDGEVEGKVGRAEREVDRQHADDKPATGGRPDCGLTASGAEAYSASCYYHPLRRLCGTHRGV